MRLNMIPFVGLRAGRVAGVPGMDAVNRTADRQAADAGGAPSRTRRVPWSISGPRLRALRALARLRGDDARGRLGRVLRGEEFAVPIKLLFVALDVALIVAVIIVPPPASDLGWPIQMRLRFQEFLYLLLLLAGAALSYSPLHVLWTGFCIVVFWSIGFLLVLNRPDTLTFA